MTPRLNTVSKLLGAQATFIGQFPSIDLMIMKVRDPQSPELPANAHSLPKPFEKVKVRGDILLVRMNKDSVPESFTKAEFERFLIEPRPAAADGGSSAGAAGEAFMAGASRGRFQECQILRNFHDNVVSVASGWSRAAVS